MNYKQDQDGPAYSLQGGLLERKYMKYEQALEYIESLEKYGIVPGLENIKNLCERMDNPQDKLRFVHIAGTNGKGSTLAYISTILKCSGLKVGRYISPTIYDYREKIQINEKYITKKAVAEGLEYIKNICDKMLEDGLTHPTPFEVETALAFWYFERENCDIVVLETGMGGLLDVTNIIANTEVSVIASISMDHTKFLGTSIEEIAAHKAGIIKPNTKVVYTNQIDEVVAVIEKVAKDKKSEMILADSKLATNIKSSLEKQKFDYKEIKKIEITLAGGFQIANAILAIEAVNVLKEKGYPISEKSILKGLKETKWDGRFSVVSKKPLFIVDGAHNEDAAEKLAASIQFYFTNKRIIYIMGMLKDKDYNRVIELTHDYADHILTVTPPNNKRALPGYELAGEISKVHSQVSAVDSIEEAVEVAYLLAGKDDVIISFGSLSFAGKIIEIVNNRDKKGVVKI